MHALELRSLGKRYGAVEALRDLSLTVERGQVHGLLGPNGSGKTTTLACALGLLRPTSGTARVLGEPAARIHRTRGRVGTVFDAAGLVAGLSVRANLEYARRLLGHAGGRGPDDVLRLTGLADLAGRRVGKLSLGQAKRVAVARALLGRPELLVLDEPLSALDTHGVSAMLALIRELAGEGLALLVSSHRLHEMEQVVTHASILARGRLVRGGSLEELRGGRGEELRVEVTPLARAREVLAGLAGVSACEPDGASGLRARLDGVTAGEVNRALVEAGCTVSALERRGRDLFTLFGALVDGALVDGADGEAST